MRVDTSLKSIITTIRDAHRFNLNERTERCAFPFERRWLEERFSNQRRVSIQFNSTLLFDARTHGNESARANVSSDTAIDARIDQPRVVGVVVSGASASMVWRLSWRRTFCAKHSTTTGDARAREERRDGHGHG